MKKYILFCLAVATCCIAQIDARAWLISITNNQTSGDVVLTSNDPSFRNVVFTKDRGPVDYRTNPVVVKPGGSYKLSDFSLPWKSYGFKITIQTNRGVYTLQEEENYTMRLRNPEGAVVAEKEREPQFFDYRQHYAIDVRVADNGGVDLQFTRI